MRAFDTSLVIRNFIGCRIVLPPVFFHHVIDSPVEFPVQGLYVLRLMFKFDVAREGDIKVVL